MAQAIARPVSVHSTLPDLSAAVAGEPVALAMLRQRALERFYQLGLPTTRQEEWRFTDVQPIATARFVPAWRAGGRVSAWLGDGVVLPGTRRLVFIDGLLHPELSQPGSGSGGLVIEGLADALRRHGDVVQSHLGRLASYEQQPFVALNTASMRDGAFLLLPPGTVLDQPLHLVSLSSGGAQPTVSYPRNLIVAGAGSRATIIESYLGREGRALSCPVSEMVLGPGAAIDHYKVVDEAPEGQHIASLRINLEQGALLSSHSLVLNGGLVRNDVTVVLDGSGADATLRGLYLADGRQHVDNHLEVRHAVADATSRQVYRGVLGGDASAVFNGRIVVEQDAQRSNAEQSNRNLLRSAGARVYSNPQLEIFADDVRCTHGSTVGQIDEEAVFYLRSRGIPREEAERLLTWAFAGEIVDSIRNAALQAAVRSVLSRRLGGVEEVV